MARTVIPFGPQHPVLPEPIHLSLVLEDERVVEALPTLGYVHRGLEMLAAKRDYTQMIQIVERVCGICSMLHAMCYCQGLEEMLGVEVPRRARMLRVVWSELHRLHSHLLWLGLFADSFGFESLFMQLWRIREKVMDLNEATTGNRVIVSVNVIGGVRADLDQAQIRWIRDTLTEVEASIKRLQSTILNDATVCKRTQGIGVLSRQAAYELGAAGPVLRGSGVAQDMRQLGYAGFDELAFEPVVEQDGDAWARGSVRFREALQSIDLVRQALGKLDGGGDTSELAAKVTGQPEGEVITRVEQPRGECLYYLKANGGKFLERMRIRTPTFANIPALAVILPGLDFADVPVVVLSIDPCISCTER
ncbi:MAG: nickel-dependent hydrogenase large subunit [Humidesulfovibrio sp.]|nr:NADH-quinone oxidoreductase subunit D [Desulfovibrio sp.]MDO9083670.1 nickel-dependent hydrogenase large subunit [Humidesulfovibrio sp.]